MATVSIFFDKRGCANGVFSVKWLVTHQRKQRLFATGLLLEEEGVKFLKQYAGGLKGTVKDQDKRDLWKEVFEVKKGVGESALASMGEAFSFELFGALVKGGVPANTPEDKNILIDNVFDWCESVEQENRKELRHGNADAIMVAANSLRRFVESMTASKRAQYQISTKQAIKFKSITPAFLVDYEVWMLKKGKLGPRKKGEIQEEKPASLTTVGIYLRAIRSVYNRQRFTARDDYPFGPGKYVIPKGTNVKKALPWSDIERIFKYEAESRSITQRSVDLWVFSYLSNGANFLDILSLRQAMDKGGEIRFIREKTKRSNKADSREVVIKIQNRSREIMNRWANDNISPNASIWSFMKTVDLDDPLAVSKAVNSIIGTTNDHMRTVAAELGIEGDVRTYAARHSFATTLLRSEAPLAFISQSLGHKSIATTQAYLGSFEDEQTNRYLAALIPEGD